MNESIGNSLIELMYRQSIKSVIPAVIGVPIAAYVLANNTDGLLWLVWLVSTQSVFAFRPFAFSILRSKNHLKTNVTLRWACLITFVVGSVVGACVWFIPQLGVEARYYIILLVAGYISMQAASCAGYTPYYLCVAAPIYIQLCIVLSINQGGHFSTDMLFTLVISFAVYIVILGIFAGENFSTFKSNLELAEKKSQLSLDLKNALIKAESEQSRAEASNRSKTRFLAAASHDLRQPVHVVSLYGAALETITSEQRVRDVVAEMNTAIVSLSSQLDALLDISKIDAGRVEPNITCVDIHSMVDDILHEQLADAKFKGIDLVNDIKPHTCVMSDSNIFMQILKNILGNAVKYTYKGNVAVRFSVENGVSMLICQDTGIGISEYDLKYIFEEFYQAGNAERNRNNGLGLGLSIVERLLKLLSHRIRIESSPGIGTRVMISLEQAVRDSYELQSVELPSLEVNYRSHYNLWIHLVDDDVSVLKSMTVLLMELGCKVTSTSTTNETNIFLQSNTPDAFFVDYRLQGDDSGTKTLSAIKSGLPYANCLMITGETLLEIPANINDDVVVLQKPIDKTALEEILGSICVNKMRDQ